MDKKDRRLLERSKEGIKKEGREGEGEKGKGESTGKGGRVGKV